MEENSDDYINMDNDTRELLDVVANVKFSEKCKTIENGKEKYNMLKAFEDMREDGRAEGKIEGKIEGKVEAILELLEELGQVPQRLIELIWAEDNPNVLSRWHKSAAKAASIAEFEANM